MLGRTSVTVLQVSCDLVFGLIVIALCDAVSPVHYAGK